MYRSICYGGGGGSLTEKLILFDLLNNDLYSQDCRLCCHFCVKQQLPQTEAFIQRRRPARCGWE